MSQAYWDIYYLITGLLPEMVVYVFFPIMLVGVVVRFLRQNS